MNLNDIENLYSHLSVNSENPGSDNKLKCIKALLEFHMTNGHAPHYVFIDEVFDVDFRRYLLDSKFRDAFAGVAVKSVPRMGRTVFKFSMSGIYNDEMNVVPRSVIHKSGIKK